MLVNAAGAKSLVSDRRPQPNVITGAKDAVLPTRELNEHPLQWRLGILGRSELTGASLTPAWPTMPSPCGLRRRYPHLPPPPPMVISPVGVASNGKNRHKP